MFFNTDFGFYGSGGVQGGLGGSGWGMFQDWKMRGTPAAAAAPVGVGAASGPIGGVADPMQALASNPYDLNPATIESFLQKHVHELGGFQGIGQYVGDDMRSAYSDWLGTTEALTHGGAGQYLNRMRESGGLDTVLGGYRSQFDQYGNPIQQYTQEQLSQIWSQRGIMGQDIAQLHALRDRGLTLSNIDPERHGVSKHRRERRDWANMMGRAVVGF